MKKVAVIGSNSFAGADLIDLILSERDYEVLGISRSPEKEDLFLPYKKNPALSRFTFHQADLNNGMEEIKELLEKARPEYIVNFAAQGEVAPSWDNPEQWFLTNAVAVASLSNFLRKCDWLRRYVHISTPEVYGTCDKPITEDAVMNPSTPYAASKAAGDLMLFSLNRQFAFPMVMIRSTNYYGAYQQLHKIIPRTIIYLGMKKKIMLHGGGAAVKSYIHIRDVSIGELAAMENGKPGSIYHLSPKSGISIKDLVMRICDLMGKSFHEAAQSVDERPGQDKAYIIDSSKAARELNWAPKIEMEEGLKGVIDWVEEYREKISTLPLEYVHKP